MFKRAGAMASMSILLALTSLPLAAGVVTAKPYKSASIDETSACHFTVTYSYSAVGGGPNLTLTVILYRQEVGTTDWTVVDSITEASVSGGGAMTVSPQFADSGQTTAGQYRAYGYLHKEARTIRNSQAWTDWTAPETCS